MSNNALKTPLQQSLNVFAQKKAGEAIAQLGKALPCSVVSVSGQIVTVKFEVQAAFTLPQVTIPVASFPYILVPVQPGDVGMCVPADARLTGISGQSGDTAPVDLTPPANLTALLFVPVSMTTGVTFDGNILTMWGPNGVKIQTKDGSKYLEVSSSGINATGNMTVHGNLTVTGTSTLEQDVSVTGTLTASVDVISNLISLVNHLTTLVQVGTGISGPPVP